MATVGVRQLQREASGVVARVASTGRPVVVTRRGEPVAALVAVDPEALEDFILANAPVYVRSMREADLDLVAGRTRDSRDVFAEVRASESAAPRSRNEITGDERRVLALLAEGLTNRAIAGRLRIPQKDVRSTIASIVAKLGVAERVHS